MSDKKMPNRKMPNVETLRELTADELDIIAGGSAFSDTIVSNNGSASFEKFNRPGTHDLFVNFP